MSEVFLDTSIAIARVVHSAETKKRIEERISKYESSVFSLVVRQEFKRRLLKEAQYLLRQLKEKKSYLRVLRHVSDVLGPWHARKRNICLEALILVHEGEGGKPVDDSELTERAKRTLRSLLRGGLKDLASSNTYEVLASQCACAQYPVVEKLKYERYEFGPEQCSKTGGRCGIADFLVDHKKSLNAILTHLKSITKKSSELEQIQGFIENVLANPGNADSYDPCLKVGDLIIALESSGIEAFYTLNRKESLHLSRLLSQDLIIRPKNPTNDDEIFLSKSSHHWPAS